jgi:hypothetical protein
LHSARAEARRPEATAAESTLYCVISPSAY